LIDRYARRHTAVEDVHASGLAPLPYLGVDVPRELIEAVGLSPLRLFGDPAQALEQERILGAGVDPMVRALLPGAFERARGLCPALILAHDGEGALRLFHALRYLARQHPERAYPEMYCFDLLHLPRSSTERYNRRRLAELVSALERWSGRSLQEASLRRAIDRENRKRSLLRQVQALRRSDATPLSGGEAVALIGACSVLPAAQSVGLLEQALVELRTRAPRRGCRVFVTGSDWDHPAPHATLEAQGALVVGEDLEHGDLSLRAPLEPTGDDLLSDVASHYHRAPPTGRRYTGASRAQQTLQAALLARAERVVCVLRAGDPAPAWDVPEQRRLLHDAGLAFVVLAAQPYAGPSPAAARAALEAA
jgi:benzoyl-CoA reductase/2-hydroxyglutaryl-CoA dehydratase subunit BcrC/BadD/HgdB